MSQFNVESIYTHGEELRDKAVTKMVISGTVRKKYHFSSIGNSSACYCVTVITIKTFTGRSWQESSVKPPVQRAPAGRRASSVAAPVHRSQFYTVTNDSKATKVQIKYADELLTWSGTMFELGSLLEAVGSHPTSYGSKTYNRLG